MSSDKDLLLEKIINIGGGYLLILGITFITLNTLFPICPSIALTNWLTGLIIGIFFCVTSILNSIAEYNNDDFPTVYKVWMLLYPILLIGAILVLLYGHFVSPFPSKGLNWAAGILLALTLCVETYLDDKYDDLDE